MNEVKVLTYEQQLGRWVKQLVDLSRTNPRLRNFLEHHEIVGRTPNGVPVWRTNPSFWSRSGPRCVRTFPVPGTARP